MEEMKTWRLIENAAGPAAWNMAVDEMLLEGFGENGMPILRLYGWDDASLSFGRFSKPMECVELEKVGRQKLSCVRRPSGGGVLVHGNDLSYALVLPRRALGGKSVKESYAHLCSFLIRMYEKMGLKAHFARETGAERRHSDICLAAHEPYDILIDGKKMGGNAQRYTSRALLQHGTIPLAFDRALFEPLFREESGLGSAATLDVLGVALTRQVLAERVIESFCETFGTQVVREGLNSSEEERARELMVQKYNDQRWTFYGKQTVA